MAFEEPSADNGSFGIDV